MKRFLTFVAFAGMVFAAAAVKAQTWKPLLSPIEVATLAGDPLLIDIRPSGAPGFAAGHPPGAVSAPYGKWRGPKDNPGQPLSDAALTELLQSIGAEVDRPTVVVWQGVNATDFGAAARVYWTLKSAGLSQIAIMDGGVHGWVRAHLPLVVDTIAPKRSSISASLSTEWMATREEVAAITSGEAEGVLVDARPVAFQKGAKKHPAAAKAGTLAGATQFTHDGWFASKTPVLGGGGILGKYRKPAGEGPVVSFCNTGHWAATNWFMMSEIQGLSGVKLYPESMVGWTRSNGDVVTQ